MVRTRQARARPLVATLVLGAAATAGVAWPAAAPAQGSCPPFQPAYGTGYDGSQIWPGHPVQPPALDGPSLDMLAAWRAAGTDTDGDGTADTVANVGDPFETEVRITRGDGQVVLAKPGWYLDGETSPLLAPLGDLDGDGHDELWVDAVLVGPEGQELDTTTYLLPGSTAPGTHSIEDVAVELDPAVGPLLRVGAQVGGPGEDVLAAVGGSAAAPAVALVDGAALLAGGGGSVVTDPPVALGPMDMGRPVGVVDLTAGSLAVVFVGPRDGEGRFPVVLWAPVARIDLVTPPFTGPNPPAFDTATAFAGEAGPVVRLIAYVRGGADTSLYWFLPDLCRGLPPATTTTTTSPTRPPPAEPVAADAAFTG